MILAGGDDTDHNYTIFVKKNSVVDNFFCIHYLNMLYLFCCCLKEELFSLEKYKAATEYHFFLFFLFYFTNLQPPTQCLSENSEGAGKDFKVNIYKLYVFAHDAQLEKQVYTHLFCCLKATAEHIPRTFQQTIIVQQKLKLTSLLTPVVFLNGQLFC